MKNIKSYYTYLNEILIHPDYSNIDCENNEKYIIISYDKYIYMICEDVDVDKYDEYLNIFKKLFGKEFNDIDDLMEFLREERADVIILNWDSKEDVLKYHISLNYNMDYYISKQFIETIKTLQQKLKVSYLSVFENYMDNNDDKYDNKEYIFIDSIISNFNKDLKVTKLPKIVYHGTDSDSFMKILKIGIRPNRNKSNFKNVYKNNNYIYLSSNKIDSIFYANNSANISKSFPIIMEIDTSCIDIDKIDKDYDFYTDYIGKGNDYFDDIYNKSKSIYSRENKHFLNNLHDKYIGATYRKFSYKGSILPKYITKIYYKENIESDFDSEYSKDDFDTFMKIIEYAQDMGFDNEDFYLDEDSMIEYFEDRDDEYQEDDFDE